MIPSQGWPLKNKILGLITVRTFKRKKRKTSLTSCGHQRKEQAETDGRDGYSDLCYNLFILAGVISGQPGFLSSDAAALTQVMVVGETRNAIVKHKVNWLLWREVSPCIQYSFTFKIILLYLGMNVLCNLCTDVFLDILKGFCIYNECIYIFIKCL